MIASSSDTNPFLQIKKILFLGCKYFLLYSLNYLDIIINFYSFMCVLLFIFILLNISYCIIIHPRICNFVIWGRVWCRTRVRHARLVSYAFLYTTPILLLGYASPFFEALTLSHHQSYQRFTTYTYTRLKNSFMST